MRTAFNIALLFVSTFSFAQTKLYVSATVGNYSMKDNKDLQEEMLNQLPENIAYKIVDEFPVSLQADLGIDIDLKPNDITLGGFLNYAMTHGRIDYRDYSGRFTIDQNVERFVIGAKGMKHLGAGFWAYAKAGLVFSSLKIKFSQEIYDFNINPNDEEYDFDAKGILVEPGFRWEHTINRFVFFGQAGYELNINGKTNYSDDTYLQDEDGDAVYMNWSGARLGIGIGFRFQKLVTSSK